MKDEATRIREAVDAMTSLCNVMGHDTKAFVARMATEHRTLQQAFTGVCLQWLKLVASENYDTDARNEYSQKIARKLLKDIEDWELNVPVI